MSESCETVYLFIYYLFIYSGEGSMSESCETVYEASCSIKHG